MGLLSERGVPAWHPAPKPLVEACRKAMEHCKAKNYPIEKLAMQFSVSNPRIATTLFSTTNPENVKKNIAFIEEPIDWELVREVQEIIGEQKRVSWQTHKTASFVWTIQLLMRTPSVVTAGYCCGRIAYPTLENGRSEFMGEIRQMVPPFMIDGVNSAEVFLSNMDYAQVAAAVITQEFIDGIQNDYCRKSFPIIPTVSLCAECGEFRKPGFLEQAKELIAKGFKAIKIPAQRLLLKEGRVMLDNEEMMQMFHSMEERKCHALHRFG